MNQSNSDSKEDGYYCPTSPSYRPVTPPYCPTSPPYHPGLLQTTEHVESNKTQEKVNSPIYQPISPPHHDSQPRSNATVASNLPEPTEMYAMFLQQAQQLKSQQASSSPPQQHSFPFPMMQPYPNNNSYSLPIPSYYSVPQQQQRYPPQRSSYSNQRPKSWNEISGTNSNEVKQNHHHQQQQLPIQRKEYVVHYSCPCGSAWGSTKESQKGRYMKCNHCGRSRLPENSDIKKMNATQVNDANKSKQYMTAGWNAVKNANENTS
jgi:hypothetical protein